MKKKTVLLAGIIGMLLVFGAVVALAQNTGQKTKGAEHHEYTPEMMENMSENCPGEMMGSEIPARGNPDTAGENHCTDMDSDMNSMMTKPIM